MTFPNFKVSPCKKPQNLKRKKKSSSAKTARYARIVLSYLSAEKQHAKVDKNNDGASATGFDHITGCVNQQPPSYGWLLSGERQRLSGQRQQSPVSLRVTPPFIRTGDCCQVPLVLELHFVLPNLDDHFCFSREACVEVRKVRLN